MKNTRLEILKNDSYIELQLMDSKSIKYNKVINKIGSITTRELSHSNTFAIPWTAENSKALGLNVFNSASLANALNTKYNANYYVEDQLLQTGFVVVNNTQGGVININFIDEALSITSEWGSTSYKDLLQSSLLNSAIASIDSEFTDAIQDLRNYTMPKTGVVSIVGNISATKGYPMALFPNTLNCIGDSFQVYEGGGRTANDKFNPYQTRPLYNAMAFIYTVCYAYGYTPILNSSVDWENIEETYLAADGLDQGEVDDSGITDIANPVVSYTPPHHTEYIWFTTPPINIWQTSMEFSGTSGISASAIANFPSNPTGINSSPASLASWRTSRKIYIPTLEDDNVGEIKFLGTAPYTVGNTGDNIFVYWAWTNTSGGDVITEAFPSANLTKNYDTSTSSFEITIDKVVFDSPPTNGGDLVGIYITSDGASNTQSSQGMLNMSVEESYLPSGFVSFDEQGQFLQEDIDLTYAAPQSKNIKELLNGLLQAKGMLMNIDTKTKEIEFFTYAYYGTQVSSGNFKDWADYLQEYESPKFNTNFGNQYAIKNDIGLGSPYRGNTFSTFLGNQTEQSRLKEYGTNYNTVYNDVTKVLVINNPSNPYTEYSVESMALVESDGFLGTVEQQRFDKSSQGNITGIPLVANVNYSYIPSGVRSWYKLLDESVRCKPMFLLPLSEIRNLDLREPIYIEKLGGYYIIEEIDGYVDSTTPVMVKLIKLSDSFIVSPPQLPSSISLTSSAIEPNGFTSFNWVISNNYSFNNYTPTSATIEAIQVDSGGIPTGLTKNGTIDISSSNFTFNFPIVLGSEEGTWNTKITDNQSLESNETSVFVGTVPLPPSVSLLQLTEEPLVNDSSSQFLASINFTPVNTTGTLELQKVDVNFGTGVITNVGSPFTQTVTGLLNGPNTFTVSVTAGGSDYHYIKLTVDGIGSNDRPFAGGSFPFVIV